MTPSGRQTAFANAYCPTEEPAEQKLELAAPRNPSEPEEPAEPELESCSSYSTICSKTCFRPQQVSCTNSSSRKFCSSGCSKTRLLQLPAQVQNTFANYHATVPLGPSEPLLRVFRHARPSTRRLGESSMKSQQSVHLSFGRISLPL